jgi:hypothetical protein
MDRCVRLHVVVFVFAILAPARTAQAQSTTTLTAGGGMVWGKAISAAR